MSDLKSRLRDTADQWAGAHDSAPLSRLGKAVANDANFFERIAAGGGVNLATLEKFAAFLADPANWPEGAVPGEAMALAHAVGVSAPAAGASTGSGGELSPAGADTDAGRAAA